MIIILPKRWPNGSPVPDATGLTELTNYTAGNKTNFDNPNYNSCDTEAVTYFSEYDLLPLSIGGPARR